MLGFDGGCSACGELTRRIEERLAGRLEVHNLRDPQVEEWRKKALGEDIPLAPTLFEVRGDRDQPEVVRAWTGWRLGANLGRFLSPADTWRITQELGEVGKSRMAEGPYAGSARTTAGLTRGQFLKGVGGAAIAMSVLSATGKLASPAEAAQSTALNMRTNDDVVGASAVHPKEWSVECEQHTFDGTYGFKLWKPVPGSSADHGVIPAIRVALAYDIRPSQIEQTVRDRVAEYPNLHAPAQASTNSAPHPPRRPGPRAIGSATKKDYRFYSP